MHSRRQIGIVNDFDTPEEGELKAHNKFQLKVTINPRPETVRMVNYSLLCLVLSTVIATLSIIIVIMVMHFNSKGITLRTSSSALTHISGNLNSEPIMDIKPGHIHCVGGYSAIMIKMWSGTSYGCACGRGSLHSGSCGKYERFCPHVKGIGAIPMYGWRDSFWCVKRAKLGKDYLKVTDCPSGYRSCSPSICMLSSLDCPLTSVTLTSNSVNADSQQYGSSHYITTYRVDGDAPLIDISVTENGIPCFSPDQTAKGPTRSYPLLINQADGCGRYGFDSQNSFWLDQRTEFALLNDNKFPQGVFHLPWYVDNLKGTVSYLSGRTRMPVNNKNFCQSMDSKTVNKLTKAVKKLNVAVTATSITAIVIHSMLILALIFMFIGISCQYSCKGFTRGKDSRAWTYTFLICVFVEIILFMIMVILVSVFRITISEYRAYFMRYKEENCFTEGPAPLVIDDLDVIIEDIPMKFLKLSVALFVINSASFILVICLRSYRKKLKRALGK